ncbi:DUF5068 domain-containing protein [Bacillus tuaregi]|uniref:DUF5068 domain-containing protein n=1 Tax=Bacillus tuaregi TaxID=1816695 RepID=UPI001113DDFB|nr:DUF5068 domain-containing protein [Bacillus tuaregi]
MLKRKNMLWTVMIAASLLLSACGGNDEKASTNEEESTKTEENNKNEKSEKSNEKDKSEKNETAKGSGGVLNPFIAEESEGNIEVVYTNNEPNYSHDMNGFKVAVDEYQIVSLKDIHKDYTYVFDDQSEGYIITAKVTLENTLDKPMYYTPMINIEVANEFEIFPSQSRLFVEDENTLFSKKESDPGKYAAGEKVTGFVTFALTNEEYQSLATVNPKLVIEGGAADNDSFKGSFRGDATFDFIYSDEQKDQLASQPAFYQDELLLRDMAEKKMIFEKMDIGQTQVLGDVNITLDGIQYTEVIPTEAYKEAFVDFGDSGIVAITMNFIIDNTSQEPLSAYWTSGKLIVDDTRATYLSTGQLEPEGVDEIKPGEKGEKMIVFLLRKDEFGIYKKFDLEFGPLRSMDNQDLAKGYTVTFELPRE